MVTVRTLGGVEILDAAGDPVSLRSRKHVGLLLLLLGGGSRVYSRSRLCEVFWSSDQKKSRHSLSQAMYDLSTQLGPIIQRGPGENVTVNREMVTYDVRNFELALKAGELEKAVNSYKGNFAANLVNVGTDDFERWLDSERTRLARLGEIALRRYLENCEARGSWGTICIAAVKLLAMAPLDEGVHRAFIRALWLSGDTASALRHYESVSATLESELPSGISAELKELVDRIRADPKFEKNSHPVDREPPFVGRGEEFKQLQSVIKNLRNSGSSAVVIVGEPGIGKSRFISELHRSIGAEAYRVLMSRCYQAEEDLPYTPVVDALTPVIDDLASHQPGPSRVYSRLSRLFPSLGLTEDATSAAAIDPSAWQLMLYDDVASLLMRVTENEAVVWIVDDVQWIDSASAGLFHYLLRRLRGRPFLLIVTQRSSGSIENFPPIPLMGSELAGLGQRVRLGPLAEEDTRKLVDSAASFGEGHPVSDLAIRLSAGNPYYALEVLEAAAESSEWAQSASGWAPLDDGRLRKLLGVRLSGLSQGSLRVLQTIAVLERQARPRMVAQVAGMSMAEAALLAGDLYARSLIIDDGQRIAFANDTMREFVYNEMSSIQRTALHLGAGQALESDVGSPPGSLATHFYHGDDWPRSYGYAMEAACDAQRTAGHAEAAHFAKIAAEVAPGAAEKKAALTTRAESLYAAGDLAEAAITYSKLLTSSGSRGSEGRARTYLKLAETQIERCKWQEARRAIEESHRVMEEVGNSELGLSLRADRATLLLKYALRTSDAEAASEATRCINATLSGLRGVNTSASAAWLAVLSAKAMLLGVEGRSQEALQYLERASSHVPESDQSQAARYYNYRGVVKAWLADWDGAEADFHKARKIAETTGDRVGLTTQWNNLACVALERGEWGEAQSRLDKAESVHRELCFNNDASLPIVLNRADLLFYQGYLAPAAEAYAKAVEICHEQESNDRRGEAMACLGLVALQRGQGEEARRIWQILSETEARTACELGTRERFKIAWFTSAMASSLNSERKLLRAAEREKERDRPSYLKLLWLSTVLEQDEAVDQRETKEALRASGLGWFCHVANRWTRSAMRAQSG